MFAAALIVFRESLEAALIIGIMAAATRGIPWRGRWMMAGVLAGILGAMLGPIVLNIMALTDWASRVVAMGTPIFRSFTLPRAKSHRRSTASRWW